MSPEGLADALLEACPVGILAVDPSGRVVVANPVVCQLIGLPATPRGSPGQVVLRHLPVLAAALEPGRADASELSLSVGGRELRVRVRAGPFPEPGGRLAVVEDITALQQAERYQTEFVADVSHELRTPTTSIVGYAETLLEEADRLEPDVLQMVEVIHRNAQRLSALFEALLALARLEARREPLPAASVSVSAVASEVLDKWRPAAAARNITLQTTLPAGLRVLANHPAMVHMVGNLIENAVKYSYDGGLVTLRAWTRGGRVCIEIIDVGVGIDPEHHHRIFERFYRVDKSRSRAAGGSGLGLAIVKRLADAMSAELEVRSKLGHGSVFRVWMPPAPPIPPA